MTMLAKSLSCGNLVFIDDPQVAPAHKAGIMVASKGEGVKAFKPTVVSIASLRRFSK
jgi:hypothetical protein